MTILRPTTPTTNQIKSQRISAPLPTHKMNFHNPSSLLKKNPPAQKKPPNQTIICATPCPPNVDEDVNSCPLRAAIPIHESATNWVIMGVRCTVTSSCEEKDDGSGNQRRGSENDTAELYGRETIVLDRWSM
jgi:hypothetical protein